MISLKYGRRIVSITQLQNEPYKSNSRADTELELIQVVGKYIPHVFRLTSYVYVLFFNPNKAKQYENTNQWAARSKLNQNARYPT